MIELKNSGVVFDEAAHTYNLDGKELMGITSTIIAWMFPLTYSGIPEEVLAKAAEHGHFVHSCIEMADEFGATEGCPESQQYLDLISKHRMKCIAHEYIVTDFKEFASAIDLVLMDENGDIWLGDIKTTSQLHESKVRLQLSIYAYLFELLNPTLKVKGLVEVWLPKSKYGNASWIELPRTASVIVEETISCYLTGCEAELYAKYYEVQNAVSEIPTRYLAMIDSIAELEEQAKAIKIQQEEMKATLLNVFNEYGVKKFDNDRLSIAKVNAGTRKTFDSKSFKSNHPELYDAYMTETQTKESIRITIKSA